MYDFTHVCLFVHQKEKKIPTNPRVPLANSNWSALALIALPLQMCETKDRSGALDVERDLFAVQEFVPHVARQRLGRSG